MAIDGQRIAPTGEAPPAADLADHPRWREAYVREKRRADALEQAAGAADQHEYWWKKWEAERAARDAERVEYEQRLVWSEQRHTTEASRADRAVVALSGLVAACAPTLTVCYAGRPEYGIPTRDEVAAYTVTPAAVSAAWDALENTADA